MIFVSYLFLANKIVKKAEKEHKNNKNQQKFYENYVQSTIIANCDF